MFLILSSTKTDVYVFCAVLDLGDALGPFQFPRSCVIDLPVCFQGRIRPNESNFCNAGNERHWL